MIPMNIEDTCIQIVSIKVSSESINNQQQNYYRKTGSKPMKAFNFITRLTVEGGEKKYH